MKFRVIGMLIFAGSLAVHSAEIKESFESGDFTGWTHQGEGWSVNSKLSTQGENSALCIVKKGEQPTLKACARIVENSDPGWVVKAQIDVAGKVKSKSSKISLTLMCIDSEGNTIKESKKTMSSPSQEFKKVLLEEIVVPSGTAEVYFMIAVEVVKPAKSKEWWRFDNVIITVE